MPKDFIIDIHPEYEMEIYQKHDQVNPGQGHDMANQEIADLKSLSVPAFVEFQKEYGCLPSVGDRVEIEAGLHVVVELREYLLNGNSSRTRSLYILVRQFNGIH